MPLSLINAARHTERNLRRVRCGQTKEPAARRHVEAAGRGVALGALGVQIVAFQLACPWLRFSPSGGRFRLVGGRAVIRWDRGGVRVRKNLDCEIHCDQERDCALLTTRSLENRRPKKIG